MQVSETRICLSAIDWTVLEYFWVVGKPLCALARINRYICVMSEGNNPAEPDIYPESEECPAEDSLGFGDDLELNQFDGLPFSSRYYKLLKERKTLPVWKVRCEFEDALVNNQLVIVSGTAKTGRSTQVRGHGHQCGYLIGKEGIGRDGKTWCASERFYKRKVHIQPGSRCSLWPWGIRVIKWWMPLLLFHLLHC